MVRSAEDGVKKCEKDLVGVDGRCEKPAATECGDEGLSCCPFPPPSLEGSCNSPDLTCRSNPFNTDKVCVACGNEGEDCCFEREEGDRCNGELTCFNDPLIADEPSACFACGEEGQPICSGASLLSLLGSSTNM